MIKTNVIKGNCIRLNKVVTNAIYEGVKKIIHIGHYITSDGLHYKTSDGSYYVVKS